MQKKQFKLHLSESSYLTAVVCEYCRGNGILRDNTKQFEIQKKTYTQQFSQLYFARLQSIRPAITKNLNSRFVGQYRVGRVSDVQEDVESIVIGTIFCEIQSRPNIFQELENDQISNYRIDQDKKLILEPPTVFLEDESGRMELDISAKTDYMWVTGVCLGLKGRAETNGKFSVLDVIEPGLPTQPSRNLALNTGGKKYVALVSGLQYGRETSENSFARSLLFDLLSGNHHALVGKNIAKLIVAGNTMSSPIKTSNEFKKKYGNEISRYKVDHLHQFDQEVSRLSKSIDIEIMPGEDDLSTVALPQKPVPSSLFPSISSLDSVNFTSNPTLIDVESIKFLGCSGQNIDDAYHYVTTNDRLLIAENTLSWRIIAPTSPDSLYCYPFYDKDPFVINESPHVYFIGNQLEFATKTLSDANGTSVQIILVPDFSKTSTIVLVELGSLQVSKLSLKY